MYRTAFLPYSQLFYEFLQTDKKNNMQVLQYHDCYEIYLMTKGERYLFFNGICHILKPGDLFIVRPFEMHYTQSLDSSFYARHLLNFSDHHLEMFLTFSERRLLLDKIKSCIIHLNDEQFSETCFYFRGISESSSPNSFLAEKRQYSFLLLLLTFLSKCIESAELLSENPDLPDVKPEILQAIHYINRHYTENLSLEYIADYVHLSKYYFCRQFSKTTGATFLEYVTSVRLTKVHQLLLSTELSLAEIAEKTGFSSPVQLSRSFRSVYGVSPSLFRKEKK